MVVCTLKALILFTATSLKNMQLNSVCQIFELPCLKVLHPYEKIHKYFNYFQHNNVSELKTSYLLAS